MAARRLGLDPMGDVLRRLAARPNLREADLLEVVVRDLSERVEVDLVLGEEGEMLGQLALLEPVLHRRTIDLRGSSRREGGGGRRGEGG